MSTIPSKFTLRKNLHQILYGVSVDRKLSLMSTICDLLSHVIGGFALLDPLAHPLKCGHFVPLLNKDNANSFDQAL